MSHACHLPESELLMSPRRRRLPVRPRVAPVGPWGHYVDDLRISRGWKQRQMYDPLNKAAEDLGYKGFNFDRVHIRRWIGGVAPGDPKTLQIIATAWNVPIRTVTEKTEAQRAWRYEQRRKGADEAAPASPARDTLQSRAEATDPDDDMNRRQLIQGAAVGLLAVLKPGAYDRLRATLGNADTSPAEHFLMVRKTLADNDNLFGPQQVIPTATRQIETMQAIRASLRGQDLRELLSVQTQFADLLGWLHQDRADYVASQYWMDRALEWANLASDHDSIVFVLARKSQLAADARNPIEAVDAAEAAIAAGRPTSRLVAIAATYAAHGHALRGDHASSEQLYAQARALLEDAHRDNSPWGIFFDGAYISVQQAHSLAALGDYRRSAEAFRSAINNLQPGYHRDRGVYLAREALAYANLDELEHAATLGLQALLIGLETNSNRTLGHLMSVDNILKDRSTNPDTARFHDAMVEAGLHTT